MLIEKQKIKLSESEQKAFQLLTIARFILARTPMIFGYAEHNKLIEKLSRMTEELNQPFSLSKHNNIIESSEWKKIQKILNI